jgi:hypothetical protein
MIASGAGLYYPYTHFRSPAWLKLAALYYDEISRIIPDQFAPDDSDEVKALTQAGILHRLDPTGTAEAVAEDFIDYAYAYLFDQNQRKTLFPELAASGTGFLIQPGKMAQRVRQALIDLGMTTLPEHGGDLDLDAVTGGVYMAFLARKMSAERGLPVVTHDPVFQKLIYKPIGANATGSSGGPDPTFALASLIVDAVVPENPGSIPIDSILKFREKHSDQRKAFYDEVVKLTSAIDLTENEAALNKNLKNKQSMILKKVDNLEKAFKDVKIATARNLFFASIPSWVTGKWALSMDHGPIVVGTAAVGAVLSLVSGFRDIERQKRESPWSYVLSLRNLRPGLLHRIEHRNELITIFSNKA